jgi:hypothetical protein
MDAEERALGALSVRSPTVSEGNRRSKCHLPDRVLSNGRASDH